MFAENRIRTSLLIINISVMGVATFGKSVNCPEKMFFGEEAGRCVACSNCTEGCPPGYSLSTSCSYKSDCSCEKCPPGTYQSWDNFPQPSCLSCKERMKQAPPGTFVNGCGGDSEGTLSLCSGLREGYYFNSNGGETDECTQAECSAPSSSIADGMYQKATCSRNENSVFMACTACSESQYELQACKQDRDTVCLDIPNGMYVPEGVIIGDGQNFSDFLKTCTTCSPKESEKQPCVNGRDTVCEPLTLDPLYIYLGCSVLVVAGITGARISNQRMKAIRRQSCRRTSRSTSLKHAVETMVKASRSATSHSIEDSKV